MTQNETRHMCKDINECETQEGLCSPEDTCINVLNSYRCQPKIKPYNYVVFGNNTEDIFWHKDYINNCELYYDSVACDRVIDSPFVKAITYGHAIIPNGVAQERNASFYPFKLLTFNASTYAIHFDISEVSSYIPSGNEHVVAAHKLFNFGLVERMENSNLLVDLVLKRRLLSPQDVKIVVTSSYFTDTNAVPIHEANYFIYVLPYRF